MDIGIKRSRIADTEEYIKHVGNKSFTKLEQAVLATWKNESTSGERQLRLYKDLDYLDRYLRKTDLEGIERKAERLKQILDENLEVAAWVSSYLPHFSPVVLF